MTNISYWTSEGQLRPGPSSDAVWKTVQYPDGRVRVYEISDEWWVFSHEGQGPAPQ